MFPIRLDFRAFAGTCARINAQDGVLQIDAGPPLATH